MENQLQGTSSRTNSNNNCNNSNNLVLKNLQAFLTCKRSNPSCASATAAAAGTLLSLSLINPANNSYNSTNRTSNNNNSEANLANVVENDIALALTTTTATRSSENSRSSSAATNMQFTRSNNSSNKRKVGHQQAKQSSNSTPNNSRSKVPTKLVNSSGIITSNPRNNNNSSSTSSSSSSRRLPSNSSSSTTTTTTTADEAKRNRSANYSALEKEIFISSVTPYKHILEDKRFDSETLQEKASAWRAIVVTFNSYSGVVKRDRKQLKELWKRLKDRARRSGAANANIAASSISAANTANSVPNSGIIPNCPSTSKLMKLAVLANASDSRRANSSSTSTSCSNNGLGLAPSKSSMCNSMNENKNNNDNNENSHLYEDEANGEYCKERRNSSAIYSFPVGSYGGQLRFHAAAKEAEADTNEMNANELTFVRHGITNGGSIHQLPTTPTMTIIPETSNLAIKQTTGSPSLTATPLSTSKPSTLMLPSTPSYYYYHPQHQFHEGQQYGQMISSATRTDESIAAAAATLPGITIARIAEGNEGGRHQSRELTPEGDDMKHVIPTPPPLKEHLMNLGSLQPQSSHPPLMNLHPSILPPLGGGGGLGSLVGRNIPTLGNGGGPQGNGNANNSSNSSGTNTNYSSGGGGGQSCNNSITSSPPPRPASSSTSQPHQIQLKESSPHQLLCVRWGNFDSNIISMFSKLKSQESFVDVTLWCEGKTVKCHKIILSACSTYFETLLTETPNAHPIIFLKDMKFWEIQALVEFMYKGEVSIHQEKLQCLLRAAESLQIKGLGSPSNERNGFGSNNNNNANSTNNLTNGPIGGTPDDSSSMLNNSNGLDDLSLIENGKNSIHPPHRASQQQQQHQAHRNLFNSPSSNVVNNINNSNSLLKNSQFNNHNNMNSMGIDLSNHGTKLPIHHNTLLNSLSSPPGAGLYQHHVIPAKRRKRDTPRKIDFIPTSVRPSPPSVTAHPIQFTTPMQQQLQHQQQNDEFPDDDAASVNDSMDEEEVSNLNIKSEHPQTDLQQNEDSNDGECNDNFAETNYENDQGIQSNDESSEQEDVDNDNEGGLAINEDEMDEPNQQSVEVDGDGADDENNALDLGTNNNNFGHNSVSPPGLNNERERSRKGNPIKKILLGNNNNNYNDEDDDGTVAQSLVHTE